MNMAAFADLFRLTAGLVGFGAVIFIALRKFKTAHREEENFAARLRDAGRSAPPVRDGRSANDTGRGTKGEALVLFPRTALDVSAASVQLTPQFRTRDREES
jgi:hypothetical protein